MKAPTNNAQGAGHFDRRQFLAGALGLTSAMFLTGCPTRPPLGSGEYVLDPSLCDGLGVQHLLLYGPQGQPSTATGLFTIPGAIGGRSGRVSALGHTADIEGLGGDGLDGRILLVALGVGVLAHKWVDRQLFLWDPVYAVWKLCTYSPLWGGVWFPPVGHVWYGSYVFYPYSTGWAWSAAYLTNPLIAAGAVIGAALLLHLLLRPRQDGTVEIPSAELAGLPLDTTYNLRIEVDGPGLTEHRYSECGEFHTPGGDNGGGEEPAPDLTPVFPNPGFTTVQCEGGNAPRRPDDGRDWNAVGVSGPDLSQVATISALIAPEGGTPYVMDVDPPSRGGIGQRGTHPGAPSNVTITVVMFDGRQVVFGPFSVGHGAFGTC